MTLLHTLKTLLKKAEQAHKEQKAQLEQKERELKEVDLQIPVAVADGEDDVALVLIQKKDELTSQIASIQVELEKIAAQAEEAKSGLVQFQAEIEKLKSELQRLTEKETFINIHEVRRPDVDAQLVAENIALQLERRVAFRRAMRKAVEIGRAHV